jgi:hypothetical protein
VEVFRKYLWYVLRERKFGPDAVADMVALKVRAAARRCGLAWGQVYFLGREGGRHGPAG